MSTGRLHLTASPGGHLDLLVGVREAFASFERTWVTVPGERARALAGEGERVVEVPLYGRDPRRLAMNVRQAGRELRRGRPDAVVTSGAGVVAPFNALARALGAPLVVVETMARVHSPSRANHLIGRVADRVMVQWPELEPSYPGATVCRPALLERIGRPIVAGSGTFVAVGTHAEPFHRMASAIAAAVRAGVLPGPVVVQSGHTPFTVPDAEVVPFLTPEGMRAACEQAEVVVCHAGAGIIATALAAGRLPIVMARLREHREHIDDHQLQIAGQLERYGLVARVRDDIGTDAVERAREAPSAPESLSRYPRLADALGDALAELLG